jgi:hypothetical protein
MGGVKGHKKNEISLAQILFATACPGSPCRWLGSFNVFILILGLSFVKGFGL